MPALGLQIPDVAGRVRSGFVPPPSPPSPPPPPPPPPSTIASIVIEGDSITYAGGPGNQGFAWQYAAAPPSGKTAGVNAQNSRTVGGPVNGGDGADTGTPTGNTLLLNTSADIASGANAVLTMIGTNDLSTFAVATYRQRLIAWYAGLHSAGVKVGWSPPIAMCTNQAYAGYASFMAKRATLLGDCRNPAVWGQWADYYYPMGEQPDFNGTDNTALINNIDGVHPTQPGQDLLLTMLKPVADTLFDATRAGSTVMYAARWPASETNLAPSSTITRRIVVSGLDPAGTPLGASVSGGGSPQLSLNGKAFASAFGTGSGDGWRLYNGDTIDLKLTTSASNSTPVTIGLTIGSETRSLSFTTVAMVTAATYAHQDVVTVQPQADTHTFTGLAFDSVGVALVAIAAGGVPTGVTVGGVAATKRRGISLDSSISLWTVPVTATGARDVVVVYGSFKGQTTLSWGIVRNADPTPVQVDPGADGGGPGYDGQPFLTAALTVPASGIAVAFFNEYGGGSITPATTNAGTTLVDEGNGTFQSETLGICVGERTTSGAASFNFAFGNWGRIAIVFKAAGT